MSAGSLKDVLDRLTSLDANDRVKAANEIGEIGTEKEAPIVLKVVYEDEASTVRQMAIQSYFEIMKEDGLEEIKRVAKYHTDEYVRIYAISLLGKVHADLVADLLLEFLKEDDEKIKATTIKAMIHAGASQNAEKLIDFIDNETHVLTICNIIEAWTLWRFKNSHNLIKNILQNLEKYNNSLEIKTISNLALASFGEKNALKVLKEGKIDEYYRIKIGDKHFRGKEGLIEAVKELDKS